MSVGMHGEQLASPDPGEILVVGPGARFLSGIGYHTAAIVRSLNRANHKVSAILIRRLVPRLLYPGRGRVGTSDPSVLGLEGIPVLEGLDWQVFPSVLAAMRFMRRRDPDVVLLQWWTVVTAHTYVLIVWFARLRKCTVVFEMHESHDTGQAEFWFVSRYARLMLRIMSRSIDGLVMHSEADAAEFPKLFPSLGAKPTCVIFPGPLEHEGGFTMIPARVRQPDEPVRLLYFGVIRSYKGVDELVNAYVRLTAEGHRLHLTVVGEPWEDASRTLDRLRDGTVPNVELVDRFLESDEIQSYFQRSDVVVLPYRRASASGPVNLTMATGMPLVTTSVPAIREACQRYEGVRFAEPNDPESLARAIVQSLDIVGQRFENPQSWDANAVRYLKFFRELKFRSPTKTSSGA